eukprot:350856-Chlamydomonas_euryale.AAC.3
MHAAHVRTVAAAHLSSISGLFLKLWRLGRGDRGEEGGGMHACTYALSPCGDCGLCNRRLAPRPLLRARHIAVLTREHPPASAPPAPSGSSRSRARCRCWWASRRSPARTPQPPSQRYRGAPPPPRTSSNSHSTAAMTPEMRRTSPRASPRRSAGRSRLPLTPDPAIAAGSSA